MAEEYGTDAAEVMRGIGLDPRIGSHVHAPELRVRRELPAQGTASARGRRPGSRPGHARDGRRLRGERRPAASVRRSRRRGRRRLAGKRIGLLGLAFKAGTDDVRDSPAVALAERLLAGGALVRAYDPEAMTNARRRLPDLETTSTAEAALRDADVVVIATEWPAFAALDWAALRSTVNGPLIVDGRRLLDPERVRAAGFRYERVGTASDEDLEVVSTTSSPGRHRRPAPGR